MEAVTAESSILSSRADEPLVEVSPHQHGNLAESLALIEVTKCKKANGIYELHCESYNGKPVWKRREGGGPCYIFYNSQKRAWFLNAKLSKDGGFVSILSVSDEPPLGCWNRSGTAFLATPGIAMNTEKYIAASHGSNASDSNTSSDSIEVRECKKANGIYKLQPQSHNGKELWRRSSAGACYIFFSAKKQAWYIHNKLGDQGYVSVSSTADTPPVGRWDCCGLAVLVAHKEQNVVVNIEYTITLDTSAEASRQLKNHWKKVCHQYAAESQHEVNSQDLAERVECNVTDAEGVGFIQHGLPDPDDEMAELEFPLKIQLRFPDPGAKRLKPEDHLGFVSAGAGKLAARASPGNTVMSKWVFEAGASWVVTLLRSDEPAFEQVHRQAAQLLDEGSLKGWLHLPLSGGTRCMGHSKKGRGKASEAEDRQSLAKVKEIVKLLKRGESVIVHCAAGMHRTGIMCYMTLRHLGQSPEEALHSILQSRPLTHAEITRTTKNHPPLRELAENLLSDVFD